VAHEAFLCFVSLFDSLIQGLKYARIHRSDDIHRRVQFFLRHPRFPCVRKAPVYSRIAKPHHCHRQPDEHLFAVAETFDGVSVTVEGAKISLLQFRILFWSPALKSGNVFNPSFTPL